MQTCLLVFLFSCDKISISDCVTQLTIGQKLVPGCEQVIE